MLSGARTGPHEPIGAVADFQSVSSMPGAETGAEQRGAEEAFLISHSAVVGSGLGFGDNQGLAPGEITPGRSVRRTCLLSTWTANLESAPHGLRWMSRVGEFLRARADLIPSPFPGASPDRESSLAGSQAQLRPMTPPRRSGLQGLLGASMFGNNEPPSSSSGVPSEVIQEEQRQPGVILGRLEASETQNRNLQTQLEAAQLEADQQRAQAVRLEAERQGAQAVRLEAERQGAQAVRLEAERQGAQAVRLEAERQGPPLAAPLAGDLGRTTAQHDPVIATLGVSNVGMMPGVSTSAPSQPIQGPSTRVGFLQGLFSRPKESNPPKGYATEG